MIKQSGSSFGVVAWLVSATLVIAQAAFLAWNLDREYRRNLDIEFSRLADAARIADENVSGRLMALDLMLRDVAEYASRLGPDATSAISAYMVTRARAFPEIRTVLMTDSAGIVTSATRTEVQGMDVRNRPYYGQVRDAESREATYFTPLVQTKPANLYVIFASRARPSHDGQWSGLVSAALEIRMFDTLLLSILPSGDGTTATFIGKDGRAISRVPNPKSFIGFDLSKGGAFARHLASGRKVSLERHTALTDNIEKISAARTVGDGPYVVVVSEPISVALASWRAMAVHQSLAALMLSLAVMFLTWQVVRHHRRERAAFFYARSLIEASLDPLVTISLEGKITDVNTAAEKVTGLARSKLIGTNFEKHFTEPDKAHAGYQQVLSDGFVIDYSLAVLHVSGKITHVLCNASLYRDEKGEVSGVFAAARDVTDRKRVESAWLDSDELSERFRLLFTNSPDAYFIMEIDGGIIVECNFAAETMLRGSRNQILGMMPDQLSPVHQPSGELSYQAATRMIKESLRDGHRRFEWVHRRLDGTDFWVDVSIFVTKYNRRKVLLVAWRDITERKDYEVKLLQGKERIEAVASAGVVGVWDWDVVTNCLDWDDVMCRLYGVRQEDFTGTYEFWTKAIHPDDRPRHENAIALALRGDCDYAGEFRVVWPDGSIHFINSGSKTTYDKHGKPLRIIGINYDLTSHKKIEADLQKARADADSANRAKSAFLAMMSHEIRTPITGVLGMADLLRCTLLDREQAGYLDTLASSTKTLLTILNDILDLSKIEAGKIVLEEIEFGISDVVSDTVAVFNELAVKKGVALKCAIASDVPKWVVGDPARFKQILFNLTSNAIKFTDKGHVELRISSEALGVSAVTVNVSVEDSGSGISPELIPLLFKPFSQLDNSTSRRFGGTGLGLVITKQLVGLMGGEIGVESEVARGTRFWFSLPLRVPTNHETHGAERDGCEPLSTAPRPLHILLAEDNRINQMLVSSMLQKLGHTVEVADNGRVAVAAIEAGDFDAVLMDMQMPEMDGEEATRLIRAMPPPKGRLPILALTADAMVEHRDLYLGAGVNDIVSKPIDWQLLSAALAHHTAAVESFAGPAVLNR